MRQERPLWGLAGEWRVGGGRKLKRGEEWLVQGIGEVLYSKHGVQRSCGIIRVAADARMTE